MGSPLKTYRNNLNSIISLSNIFFTPFVSSSVSTGANITPTTEESDSVLGWAKGGLREKRAYPVDKSRDIGNVVGVLAVILQQIIRTRSGV